MAKQKHSYTRNFTIKEGVIEEAQDMQLLTNSLLIQTRCCKN